jgi:hypothetical protein
MTKNYPKKTAFLNLNRHLMMKTFSFWVIISAAYVLISQDVLAVTAESMKEPIAALEKDIWGGVMRVVMVAGCIFGIGMSIVRQSLMPAGVGIGAALAGNFFKGWIEKGYAALI